MAELRQKMIRAMELRNLSNHTQRAYLSAITGLSQFYQKSPVRLSKEMVEDYLLYLKNEKGNAPNSCGSVLTGLRFFYNHVAPQQIPIEYSLCKKVIKLPTVLTPKEVWDIISSAENLKHRLILMTTYSGGLRASEVIALRPEHIDSKRMLIKVENGKGRKERYTLLSRKLLKELRHYYKRFRPKIYLFPSSYQDRTTSCYASVRNLYEKARVFTLPHELNAMVLRNKTVMLNILFQSVSRTLLCFGQNELGGKLGFMAILHSWDQHLNAHFHLHCLVAGGAVSANGSRWIPCRHNYLFNQEALSRVFRAKFMKLTSRAFERGKLNLTGSYPQLKNTLYDKTWVVSVRDPIKHPQDVLQYLARYTHRVAIANSRLLALENSTVTFTYKDRQNNQTAHQTISAVEFIRRFLLHTLPQSFVRIRHFGFLANRNRMGNLNKIRQLMGLSAQAQRHRASLEEMMLKLTGIDITLCPCCKKGTMRVVTEIPKYRGPPPNPRA